MKRFKTIVADPPWPMVWTSGRIRTNGRGETRATRSIKTALPYRTMGVPEIAALPVAELAQDDAVLFLWVPDQFVIDGSAVQVCASWGFTPLRFFVWAKVGYGMGTFPRPAHELALFARRGKVPQPKRRDVGSWQVWSRPYERAGKSSARKHSAKPPDFLAMVESVFDGPYLELFARAPRLGWTSFGNEVAGDPTVSELLTK